MRKWKEDIRGRHQRPKDNQDRRAYPLLKSPRRRSYLLRKSRKTPSKVRKFPKKSPLDVRLQHSMAITVKPSDKPFSIFILIMINLTH